MDLTHRFTVPTSVEETWAHFQDIASVAQCFPGATVSSVEDDTFAGSVKVKLGPIALVYNGSGRFVEKDEAAHRFVVEAKGKDRRGNGTAGASVTLTMADSGGATDVEVVTDLAITGKPAQFGRGVMQDVSDKLLGQFVACLETRLSGGAPVTATVASAPEAAPDAVGAAHPAAVGEADPQPPPGPPDPPPPPLPPPVAGAATSATAGAAAGSAGAGSAPRHAASDDALDLGAAVIPVLAKAYWKQGAAAFGVLAVIWWFLARRR